jgi:glycosyltransferase involved in cell wall biosynthesis
MKKVTIVIPIYNEEDNIPVIYNRIVSLFQGIDYKYEILFIDNYSLDNSRDAIRMLCKKDTQVKAIFNSRNFGFIKSTFYGLTQANGNAAVLLFADMQDPPEIILKFIEQWEKGFKIVIGVKNKSLENKIVYFFRTIYYKLIKYSSNINHIEHYTGFGLYDESFINILRKNNDSLPYLRGMVEEFGFKYSIVYYEQGVRCLGKSKFNFLQLFDLAMLGIVSYSKLLRIFTFIGCFISLLCIIIAFISVCFKIFDWYSFQMGVAAIIVGLFFLGGIQIFLFGLLGEYIMGINIRVMKHPVVVEEERINFNVNERID